MNYYDKINFKRRSVEESKLIVQGLLIWDDNGIIIARWVNSIMFI